MAADGREELLEIGACLCAESNYAGAWEHGYLPVVRGDFVRVLYVGKQGEEADWLWVTDALGAQGWLPVFAVLPRERVLPPPAVTPCAAVAAEACVAQEPAGAVEVAAQEPVDPQQVPGNGLPTGGGLLPESSGRRCAVGDKAIHRRVDSKPEARSLLRSKPAEEVNAKECPAERQVSPGERVVVLAFEGTWVRVRSMKTQADGWLREDYVHPCADPPPPASKAPLPPGPPPGEPPDRPPPLPLTAANLQLLPPAMPLLQPPRSLPPEEDHAPASEARRVTVLTFGLETLDGALGAVCERFPRGGGEAKVEEDQLRRSLRGRGYGAVDVILDARLFSDPAASSVTRHVGVHPDIVARICQTVNFPRFFEEVKRKVATRLDASGSACVAFYCKSGKHRSVACAWLLEKACRHEGWACNVEHLSRAAWHNTCKGECEECREPSTRQQQRDDAWGQALRWWSRTVV